MIGGQPEVLAVEKHQAARLDATKGVRLFQDDLEYRPEVAGRGVDYLQNLGGRGLPSRRLVTLGAAYRKLAPKLGD